MCLSVCLCVYIIIYVYVSVCVASRDIETLTGEKQECDGHNEKLKTHQLVLQSKCVVCLVIIYLLLTCCLTSSFCNPSLSSASLSFTYLLLCYLHSAACLRIYAYNVFLLCTRN